MDNVAAPTFPSDLGVIRSPSKAGLRTLSPLEEGQGAGRTLVVGSPASVPHCLLFSPAHPVIENGQVECPQGYKRLNRSHCQGKDAAFISLSPSHIHCQSCNYLHKIHLSNSLVQICKDHDL